MTPCKHRVPYTADVVVVVVVVVTLLHCCIAAYTYYIIYNRNFEVSAFIITVIDKCKAFSARLKSR
jgi:hypothetical protein